MSIWHFMHAKLSPLLDFIYYIATKM